jgi:hypothetical protein
LHRIGPQSLVLCAAAASAFLFAISQDIAASLQGSDRSLAGPGRAKATAGLMEFQQVGVDLIFVRVGVAVWGTG